MCSILGASKTGLRPSPTQRTGVVSTAGTLGRALPELMWGQLANTTQTVTPGQACSGGSAVDPGPAPALPPPQQPARAPTEAGTEEGASGTPGGNSGGTDDGKKRDPQ